MTEFEYWQRLLNDLQEVMSVAEMAREFRMEDDRVIWRWKRGESRPTGLKAVYVYLLHVKRCPERQRQVSHVAEEAKHA